MDPSSSSSSSSSASLSSSSKGVSDEISEAEEESLMSSFSSSSWSSSLFSSSSTSKPTSASSSPRSSASSSSSAMSSKTLSLELLTRLRAVAANAALGSRLNAANLSANPPPISLAFHPSGSNTFATYNAYNANSCKEFLNVTSPTTMHLTNAITPKQ